MTNIFIANLDWEITSEDLKATFSAFGSVALAHVVFDAKTKKSKGFGYIEMESAEEAIAAIQALNGFEVNGRLLDVKIASPKANRPKPEDKPKKAFSPKPGGGGGYGGQKRFDNNRGGGGGGYNSNRSSSDAPRPSWNNDRPSSDSKPSWNNDKPASSSSDSSAPSGERKLRPRRKFDN